MAGLIHQAMKRLIKELQSLLKNEKNLLDIFIIGSAIKSKEKPNDIDVIAFFKEKEYKIIEDLLYSIKKLSDTLKINIHAEPVVAEDIIQPVLIAILHEGFSVKHNCSVSELLGVKAYLLYKYSLSKKTPSEKVRFSYALFGRQKNKGFLYSLGGKESGKGSVLVPVSKEALFSDFLKEWNVQFSKQRILVMG